MLDPCQQDAPTLRGEHGVRLALQAEGGDSEEIQVYKLDGCFDFPANMRRADGLVIAKRDGKCWVIFVELTSGEGKGVNQLKETARYFCENGHPWGRSDCPRDHSVLCVVVGGSRAEIPRRPVRLHGKNIRFYHHWPPRKSPLTLREFLEQLGVED